MNKTSRAKHLTVVSDNGQSPSAAHANPTQRAIPWIGLLKAVCMSDESGRRSSRSNAITTGVMNHAMHTLADGCVLSEKMHKAVIENIRMRVPHHANFDAPHPIVLNKQQRYQLRKLLNGSAGKQAKTSLKADPEQTQSRLKADPEQTQSRPRTDPRALNHLENKGFLSPYDTKRNETELYSTDDCSLTTRSPDQRELESTSSSLEVVGSLAHQPLEIENGDPLAMNGEEPLAEPIGLALARAGFAITSNLEEREKDTSLGAEANPAQAWTEDERAARAAEALQGLKELGDTAAQYQAPLTPNAPVRPSLFVHSKATLDIWYDGIATCRGQVQVNGASYFMNFVGVMTAEDRLYRARQEPSDHTFCSYISEGLVRPLSQMDLQGAASRFTASPVYLERSMTSGIFTRAFVVLVWEGERITKAIIVDGENEHVITMNPSNSTSPRSPQFKGKVGQ